MIFYKKTAPDRFQVYNQENTVIGEIVKGKSRSSFSINIHGVSWERGLPSSHGQPTKACDSLKEALHTFDVVYSNLELRDFFGVSLEKLKKDFSKVLSEKKSNFSYFQREKKDHQPSSSWSVEDTEYLKETFLTFSEKYSFSKAKCISILSYKLKKSFHSVIYKLNSMKIGVTEERDIADLVKEVEKIREEYLNSKKP